MFPLYQYLKSDTMLYQNSIFPLFPCLKSDTMLYQNSMFPLFPCLKSAAMLYQSSMFPLSPCFQGGTCAGERGLFDCKNGIQCVSILEKCDCQAHCADASDEDVEYAGCLIGMEECLSTAGNDSTSCISLCNSTGSIDGNANTPIFS